MRELSEKELAGYCHHSGLAQLVVERPVEQPEPERLVVDFALERPTMVALDGLPPELAQRVQTAIEREMDNQSVVGLDRRGRIHPLRCGLVRGRAGCCGAPGRTRGHSYRTRGRPGRTPGA